MYHYYYYYYYFYLLPHIVYTHVLHFDVVANDSASFQVADDAFHKVAVASEQLTACFCCQWLWLWRDSEVNFHGLTMSPVLISPPSATWA